MSVPVQELADGWPGQGGTPDPQQQQQQDRRYKSPDRWLPAGAVLVPTKELAR